MATFDSATIVMMAENGHSVEIDGKKIQMTIVTDAKTSEAKHSEVRVFDVPSEIKISKVIYGLNLHFSEYQALWYDIRNHCYAVFPNGRSITPIPCIATECKFEDLQEGDLFFATDDEKPDFTLLFEYNFFSKDGGFVYTDGTNVYVLINKKYKQYFKITAKP